MVNYKLKNCLPGIFVVVVEDSYERAMLFLRCQEFYESPFPEFRGQNFDLFRYMDVYRRNNGRGFFSYPSDWMGYNIPGHIAEECINRVLEANSDIFPTPYDYTMKSIIDCVKGQLHGQEKWYLIGVNEETGNIMNHEISHGLFYSNPEYKQRAQTLVRSLPSPIFDSLKKIILSLGYVEDVIEDEIQAYLSTGLTEEMNSIPEIRNSVEIFEKNFAAFCTK